MKRFLLPISLVLTTCFTYAQSGIGIGIELPHPTAILDLRVEGKGLLIPQVKLSSLNDSSVIKGGTPFNGLLVFNTTNSNDLHQGFYYWGIDYSDTQKKSKWISLGDDLNAALSVRPKLSMTVADNNLNLNDPTGVIAKVPLIDLQVITTLSTDAKTPGVYTYINEKGDKFVINVLSDVVNNISTILKEETVISELVKALTGKFGNVVYKEGKFYSVDSSTGVETPIDWTSLNTTNKTFAIEAINNVDSLVITDSAGGKVSMPLSAIANNETFVKQLSNNKTFVTSLTSNNDFITSIKANQSYGSIVDQSATENTTGVKMAKKFNSGQANSANVLFTETLTKITKSKDNNNLTQYKYTDETNNDNNVISVGQDVVNDFSTIISQEGVKNSLINLIQSNAKNPWLVQNSTTVASQDSENIAHSGSVVIGGNVALTNPKASNVKLSVSGDVISTGKFFTTNSMYADYVFEKYFTGASDLNLTYEFKSLDYVKDFVEKYNHLPGVTKISDISRTEDGKYLIDFTELSIQQLEKIEELYLHTIEQQDMINALNKKVDMMESRLKALESILNNK